MVLARDLSGMSDRIPWVVKLAITAATLVICVVTAVVALAWAPSGRENRLQEVRCRNDVQRGGAADSHKYRCAPWLFCTLEWEWS